MTTRYVNYISSMLGVVSSYTRLISSFLFHKMCKHRPDVETYENRTCDPIHVLCRNKKKLS